MPCITLSSGKTVCYGESTYQSGGYIIADNVLWSGKVVAENIKIDKDTKALLDFNDKVQADNRVENVLFPIRDGLLIARKIID